MEEENYEPLVLTHNEAENCLRLLEEFNSQSNISYWEMDVSNKNLTDISVISQFYYIRNVNVSGNRLTSEALRMLERMNLVELLADRNRLIRAELKPMKCLQRLTLNHNRLTQVVSTSVISHPLLEHLELKNNLLSTVNLQLPKLTNLELRDNALTTTAGIYCENLRQLFLAKNQIKKIENFQYLPSLQKLHLRNNQLANLDGFSATCLNLKYINLRDNKISNISELAKLNCLSNLETLIILENPFLQKIREQEGKKYRHIVLMMLPNLKKIDKIFVTDEEKNQVNELLEKIQEKGYGFTDFDLEGFDLGD